MRLSGVKRDGGFHGYDFGRVKIGNTTFFSRAKCLQYRADRPEILTSYKVRKILGCSSSTVHKLDPILRPEIQQWGNRHFPTRVYDLDRVLRVKEVRDLAKSQGHVNVPSHFYRELLEVSTPDLPSSEGIQAERTVSTRNKPKQVIKPKGDTQQRLAKKVAGAKGRMIFDVIGATRRARRERDGLLIVEEPEGGDEG